MSQFKLSRYFLKEYGSWSVMVFSYLTGLLVNGRVNTKVIVPLLAISLFMNSKQALMMWWREGHQRICLNVFIAQILFASLILIIFFDGLIVRLLPYISIPLIYVSLLLFAGEHKIYTEISGFATLTLSTLIAKLAVTGDIDLRLYIGVAIFFIAGVFKVKVQLKKGLFEKALMILYIAFAFYTYLLIDIPVIVLLPLIDNIIFSIIFYRVKLKAIGWIEFLKGVIFLLLMGLYYNQA